ncbi:MAG TPA: type 2 isopentenyl-diphosphate Delta-isomerase [bacterium]|nr:type 2 isopentenyl-diphosphate Delta-isomerase [bacterium]
MTGRRPPEARHGRRRAADPVEQRKAEHLRLAAAGEMSGAAGPGWADIRLVHHGLPRADVAAIDLSRDFLGRRLRGPLAIAAMTGGHAAARDVNRRLAAAAERFGLAMGVGSQRAALRNPTLASTYTVARDAAPTALLIANVGAAQLVPQDSGPPLSPRQLADAVSMIRADALAIHLNLLEEIVQPEGDRRVSGIRDAVVRAIGGLDVPVIAKETGAGLSRGLAYELRDLGFRALDVGGAGGTNFAAIETARAKARRDARRVKLGTVYHEWGIPTAVSVAAARAAGLPIIATGGVRTGLDAAKAIALGATLVGVGRPLLLAALEGDAAIDAWITQFLEELRVAVFLTGGRAIGDLAAIPKVILGSTRAWIEDLGYADALTPAAEMS